MKYLMSVVVVLVMLLVFWLLLFAPRHGDSGAAIVVLDVIEFDCSSHPDRFDAMSKAYHRAEPLSRSILIQQWQSDGVPFSTLLHHVQQLQVGDLILQSTAMGGTVFDLDLLRGEDQADRVDLTLHLSFRSGGEESKLESQVYIGEETPQIVGAQFGRSGDGMRAEVEKIRVVQVTVVRELPSGD